MLSSSFLCRGSGQRKVLKDWKPGAWNVKELKPLRWQNSAPVVCVGGHCRESGHRLQLEM